MHEKEEVLEAAQRACDLLTDAGIAAGCDTTVEMSPGQKFKHWCVCAGLQAGRMHRDRPDRVIFRDEQTRKRYCALPTSVRVFNHVTLVCGRRL